MKNKIINYVKNLDLKRQLGYIIVFSLLISLISLLSMRKIYMNY